MRIAMVSTPFLAVPPRDYGGTEMVVHELTEGLVERGHQVTLFATGDSTTRAELRWLFAEPHWPPSALPDLDHNAWALREVARGGFDLVHVHSAMALSVARLLPRAPLVYTLHHVRTEELSAFYRHHPDPWYVAISERQRELEISLPRVEVIHHGLDPEPFEYRETPADYVAFVGRLSPIKGPHTAIDAAAGAGLEIRVAGRVHEEDAEFGAREVEPRLRQPHVRYLGPIGMAEKVPLLRDARALLVPIDWEEPFGLIVIEAMLSGCPVVAHPRGSIPELVDEGVTGFLARGPDAMADLIRPGGALDGFDRRRCRARAVERFSRQRLVADHERLYERVVGRWRGTPSAGASRRDFRVSGAA